MTPLSPDHPHAAIHPLQVLDQPTAGYILDLAKKFGREFEWRFDLDTLHKLVQLALQHIPGLEISCCEALILRLRLAGDLAYGDEGLELTSQGDERCRSTFRTLLAAPEWHQALEGILEELTIFAETDGVPFAVDEPLPEGLAAGRCFFCVLALRKSSSPVRPSDPGTCCYPTRHLAGYYTGRLAEH